MTLASRLVSRTIQSIIVLIIVSIIIFYFAHSVPGTPYYRPLGAPAAYQKIVDAQRHAHHLDQPIWVQYLYWLKDIMHGNLGYAMLGGSPVFPTVVKGLWGTFKLVSVSWMIALLISIPWAAYNARHPYRLSDVTSSFVSYMGLALPLFMTAVLVQWLVAFKLYWLPPSSVFDSGHEGEFGNYILHMIMPWSVMAFSMLLMFQKYLRNGLIEAFPSEYVRLARAKGASEGRIVYRHLFKNVLIPFITMLGVELPNIICSAAFVEYIFRIPGIGSLAIYTATQPRGATFHGSHDYTMTMGCILGVAVVSIAANWLVDMLYLLIDPRIRRPSGLV